MIFLNFYLKNVDKRGKKGLIFEKSVKKCAKKTKNNHGFHGFTRNMRANAHERYMAGAKKRTEIAGENEGEI